MSSAALPTPAPAQFAHLLPPATLTRLVADWLAEDCPALDVGGFVVGGAPGEARLLVKSNAGNGAGAVLAGQPFVDEVFAQVGCRCVFFPLRAQGFGLQGFEDHALSLSCFPPAAGLVYILT